MTPTQTEVAVRCFCGNRLSFAKATRKQVICEKCHQPLPMKAIRQALAVTAEAKTRKPLLTV
ncbi:MAG: hypothetical protein HJJLKODD_02080 [Phycisphaerae bacterium]|nr:hypothetical protein [Phycisphaerae bacterium]